MICQQFGAYLWKNGENLHEYFTRDVSLDKEIITSFGTDPDPDSGSGFDPLWRRSALSDCSVIFIVIIHCHVGNLFMLFRTI